MEMALHTSSSWLGLSAGAPLFFSVWSLHQKAWASYSGSILKEQALMFKHFQIFGVHHIC